ncbi:hypothetical protein KAW65_06075 [candidate division WOR-3 bacterium]|nr:hypothetical protein [candidate division WOR-3 bacterium]
MWLNKITPWGEIRGKLSTTPEQAKRLFGFIQHPLAKGVIFKDIKGVTYSS